MRSFFGLDEPSEEETQEQDAQPFNPKEGEYIKASETRLTALFHLYTRYKGSPHADKMKAVFEKTESIHQYLVSRNRLHELELFHIQKTEHFLNAFSAILNYHQNSQGNGRQQRGGTQSESLFRKFLRKQERGQDGEEMVKATDSQGRSIHAPENEADVPKLAVPEITINTFARIAYVNENSLSGYKKGEIGYTSTEEEKEAFQSYVGLRLGIDAISYMGNALVNIPNSNGQNPTGFVPVIYWEGFLYALNLNDFRLFPVKMYRKR